MDLSMEDELPVNNTLLDTAVSIVKGVGPKIVEVITSHLTPAIPSIPEVFNTSHDAPRVVRPQLSPTSEVMVSPPIETVVIFQPSMNNSYPLVPVTRDTVGVAYTWLQVKGKN
jgi:hypothetical protein